MPELRPADITANKILAKRYRVCMAYGLYRIKMMTSENPVNYAERVARRKRRDGDLEYEREIRAAIEGIETSNEYRDLLHGDATPVLVLDTLTWYKMVRGCR